MTKKPPPPMACIRKAPSRSYCGREVAEREEFLFVDADYAVKNYAASEALRACALCVAQLR
jgi:hypothetical protein